MLRRVEQNYTCWRPVSLLTQAEWNCTVHKFFHKCHPGHAWSYRALNKFVHLGSYLERLLGTSADLSKLVFCSSCLRLSVGFWCVCLKRFISQKTSGKYSLWFLGGCAEYSLTLGKSEDMAMFTFIGSIKSVSLPSVRYAMFPSLHWLWVVKSSGLDRKESCTSEKYWLLTG